MRKFREKMRKFREKNGNYAKQRNFARITEFLKQMQNFGEKVAKIHQKRLKFENTRLISKRYLSASPIDGLTQTINIDLKTTRRHPDNS